jgi:hypothetical protein
MGKAMTHYFYLRNEPCRRMGWGGGGIEVSAISLAFRREYYELLNALVYTAVLMEKHVKSKPHGLLL